MAQKSTKQKPLEFKIWLDQYGFYKMKFRGDPMQLAEGLGSFMSTNPMLKDAVLVAQKVAENYEKVEKEGMESVKSEILN